MAGVEFDVEVVMGLAVLAEAIGAAGATPPTKRGLLGVPEYRRDRSRWRAGQGAAHESITVAAATASLLIYRGRLGGQRAGD